MTTAAKIMDITARLEQRNPNLSSVRRWKAPLRRQQFMIYRFCSSLPQMDGRLEIVFAVVPRLTEGSHYLDFENETSGDTRWIYSALDRVQPFVDSLEDLESKDMAIQVISGLFIALLGNGALPREKDMHIFLRVLPMPGPISEIAARLLLNATDWFSDTSASIPQKSAVWSSLVHIGTRSRSIRDRCIQAGYRLGDMPDWQRVIRLELSCWITMFQQYLDHKWALADEYILVLSTIWNLDPASINLQTGEKGLLV
ncbi:hypothetical protein B0H10DRAFT_1955453 [Mycena sp. CBHHK59/15]|nr:hypothetical protein B0H10DRAFT_1955453 [Mycena sp. CBHHK59/15]